MAKEALQYLNDTLTQLPSGHRDRAFLQGLRQITRGYVDAQHGLENPEIQLLRTPFETEAILAPILLHPEREDLETQRHLPFLKPRAKNTILRQGVCRVDIALAYVEGIDETTEIPEDTHITNLGQKGTEILRTQVNDFLRANTEANGQTEQLENDLNRIRLFRIAFHEAAKVGEDGNSNMRFDNIDYLFKTLVIALPQVNIAGLFATSNEVLAEKLSLTDESKILAICDELRQRYGG